MRDELKRTYYVGKPVKNTDSCNAVFIMGFSDLAAYADRVNENTVSFETEKYGDRTTQRPTIAHDDNDGAVPNIAVDDGVWLEQPTADLEGVYHNPPFLVDSIQAFGRKHVFVLKRTLEPR